MMKYLKKSIFASAALIVISAAAVQPALAETYRVGMECTYAPFNYRNSDGKLVGYDVDVAMGIGKILGVEWEYICQKWSGIIPGLLANKYDLIIASLTITPERQKKVDFSVPYRITVGRLVGPKSLKVKLFNDSGKPIPAGFDGLKIGIERASPYANWFAGELPKANVVFYDSNESLYLDLENGRTDMIMTNPLKAYLIFLSKDDGNKFEYKSAAIDDKKYFGTGVGIGIPRGNEALLKRLDAALIELTENGSLSKYARKYFPFDIHPDKWVAPPN